MIERLQTQNAVFRIDPIIEPIGMGFSASLERYMAARRKYPEIPVMMGVGNITELTEVDSAGVNMLLAAICEELGIGSVLTTQVINWCRTAVAEFDVARRLVYYAVANQVIPKHLHSSLAMLRDATLKPQSDQSLKALAAAVTDDHFRIFAEESGIHLINRRGHWQADGAFPLFEDALSTHPNIDPAHAFYLGYEMARAEISRVLGKQYVQDGPLSFGLAGTLDGSATVHHKHTKQDTD
jgi:dihydropteroate synthase-like protein